MTENFEVVSDLAERLADAQAQPVFTDEAHGYAVRRDGRVIDWSNHLPTPTRRSNDVALHNSTEFGAYVRRFYTPDTVLYADRTRGCVTAVFDDNPASPSALARAVDAPAAWRRDRATLVLSYSADWAAWIERDEQYSPQREFGEMIDMLRHTIVEPDAATMLEIATTLKAKVSIDYESRTNVGNGDTSFRVTRETNSRAGLTGTIEIPDEFVLSLPVFDGTAPVEVRARLRFQPLRDEGVQLGYRIRQRADVIARSFDELRADIVAGFGEGGDTLPIFAGSAP